MTNTTHIDHAAEARRLVGATETRDWNEESPYVDRRIAAAQVHATLALVEQQKDTKFIADDRTNLSAEINALKAVLKLTDDWTERGERLMSYSETAPEEEGTSLLEAGADFVDKARILRSVITTALESEDAS